MTPDAAALNPGPPVPREGIANVLRYVAGHDGRIQAEEATADIWARSVTGLGGNLVKDIIIAYYSKHDRSKPDRPPISPGWIRAEANTRVERAQNLKRLEAPREETPKGRLNMTRRTLLMWQKRGHLLDQNPDDYPDT